MATRCSTSFSDSFNQHPSTTTSRQDQDTTQLDYDYVDQPDRDYFCPVSLELLTQPHQTTCCGRHISQQAADRLIRERKPCPMCNKNNFAAHEDLYFKRKIRQLSVYCSHKKNGCKWRGELGNLDQHTTSCPKRPWNCPYCPFQSTHDIGTTDHAPHCDYKPVPCPNHCQVGTVPRYHLEKHLLTCPLQLVDCQFASAGCDVKVPRKDLPSHMTEYAQNHLMTATLINLRLTKDLQKKILEKDQQIIQLQAQLQQQNTKINAEFEQLSTKVNTKFRKVDTELQTLHTKMQELGTEVDYKLQKVENNFQNTQTKLQELNSQLDPSLQTVINTEFQQLECEINTPSTYDLLLQEGFTSHEIILSEFTQSQGKGSEGRWESHPFSNTFGKHNFILVVYTNGWGNDKTNLAVCLDKKHYIHETEGSAIVQLLNQLGDYKHITGTETQFLKEDSFVWIAYDFTPLADLGYNAVTNTQYLKDNCLKFRVYLKVNVL